MREIVERQGVRVDEPDNKQHENAGVAEIIRENIPHENVTVARQIPDEADELNDSGAEVYEFDVENEDDPGDWIDNDSDDEDEAEILPEAIEEQVKRWHHTTNQTHLATTSLLHILKQYFPHLPLDARTLLGTKSRPREKMGEGEFVYYGLEKTLVERLEKRRKSEINLDFNVDGITVHSSTNNSFWPILAKIVEIPDDIPFPIGIYYGPGKPAIVEYLEHFCMEMKTLEENGVMVNGRKVEIKLRAFIADAPAKSYIKNVKGHTAIASCHHCEVEGIRINKSQSYEVCIFKLKFPFNKICYRFFYDNQ